MGRDTNYVLNSKAIEYMCINKLPKAQLQCLTTDDQWFANEAEWMAALAARDITKKGHIRIATEGTLLASVLAHRINPELVIISDDAGQFNVLLHGLCWIHAERTINKLVGFNDEQRKAVASHLN